MDKFDRGKKMIDSQCPNCKHEFDSSETFAWLPDLDGHPTIEYLECPKCHIATKPKFGCDVCPGANSCELEEECGACAYVSFDDFKIEEQKCRN